MQQLHTVLGIESEFVFASLTAKSGHLSIEAMRKAIIKGIGENRSLRTAYAIYSARH